MFPSALCLTVSLCLVFSVDGGQRSGIGNILRRYSQVNDYQHLPLLQINLISPQTIHVDRKEAKRARETETDREKGGYKHAEAYHNLMAYFTCFFFKERKTCIVLRMQMRKNVRASQGRKKQDKLLGDISGTHSHYHTCNAFPEVSTVIQDIVQKHQCVMSVIKHTVKAERAMIKRQPTFRDAFHGLHDRSHHVEDFLTGHYS